MEDKILRMFFDIGRWEHAIDKGVDKDIRKDQLLRLTDERTRLAMAEAMMQGRYAISPPHTAQIPKENGEYRTVYVNEPIDRIVLSIANDLLFDLMPEMVHPACKSYQRHRMRQGRAGGQPPDRGSLENGLHGLESRPLEVFRQRADRLRRCGVR